MVVLGKCTVIVDEKRFIEAHTATIERNKDNRYFQSFEERLKKYNEVKRDRKEAD